MVFISSLVHALRESAERAIAHVRPPGPIKHGGTAPFKQHLRPLSTTANPRNFAQSGHTVYTREELGGPPLRSAKDPIYNLFRAIREHAVDPVFTRGVIQGSTVRFYDRSARSESVSKLTRNSYRRAFEQKAFILPQKRPKFQRNCHDVGLNLAQNFQFFQAPVYSVNLGLRAAVDELEDALQNGDRKRGKKSSLRLAAPRKSSSTSTSLGKSKPVKYFERLPQNEAGIYWDDSDSMAYSLDDDYCDTCSSAYVAGVVSPLQSDVSDLDFAQDTFAEVVPDLNRVITTMTIPMNPDVFRLLAGNVVPQDGEQNDELDYLHQIQNINDEYNAFRLHVIVPLEHGLQDGYLSNLEPQGWNAGQLYWNAGEQYAYLPVRFVDFSRAEVLAMLRADVGLRLYRILEPLVLDNTGRMHDIVEEPETMEDDGAEEESFPLNIDGLVDQSIDQQASLVENHGDQANSTIDQDGNEESILSADDMTEHGDDNDGTETPMDSFQSLCSEVSRSESTNHSIWNQSLPSTAMEPISAAVMSGIDDLHYPVSDHPHHAPF
jgi:hypothetical protein